MKQADLFKKRLTADDLANIQDNIEEAHNDSTPFAVVTKDSMNVVGDVNKTEKKTHDYVVRFRFTKDEAEALGIDPKDVVKEIGDYVIVPMEYNDVSIKPRYDLEINAAIVKILPYFYSVNEETKKIGKRSQEELIALVKDMSETIGDDLYNVVAAILEVDRRLVPHMMWNDVVDIVTSLPNDFPEVFNEAEGFSE